MKNLTLLFIFLLSLNILKGQDVGISGEYVPFSIHLNETSNLIVNFSNGDFIPYPIGEVFVKVTIPIQYYSSALPSGDFMSYFADFNDNDGDGVWFGFNTAVIPANLSGGFVGATLNLQVTGTSIALTPGLSTIFETDFENIYNDTYPLDNITYGGLVVAAPLPVKLVSFKGRSTVCNQVDLSWETASEYNSEYFVVERSIDGRQFQAIGKVKSQNKATGASYKYSDEDLYGGNRYFYRLTQVDFDGKTEVFDPITTKTGYCSGADVAMSVYPNPATDKAFIALDGFSQQDHITLEITNSLGEVVMTIQNASINTPNELKLSSIPAGVYNVKVIGFDQIASKMLIKLN